MVQTQAENAGAQEISRLLGSGLTARGYEVANLFFFRKSDSFDEPPQYVLLRANPPGKSAGAAADAADARRSPQDHPATMSC